jgi:predicted nucleic acid-binding Zn ribbon protein
MERAAKTLARMKNMPLSPGELAVRAWADCVGKVVASHTRALSFRDGALLVEVEDMQWQFQLTPLRAQMLRSLSGVLGADIVTAIHFQKAAAPRKPAVSAQNAFALSHSEGLTPLEKEAQQLRHPSQREIYRRSGKKRSAS